MDRYNRMVDRYRNYLPASYEVGLSSTVDQIINPLIKVVADEINSLEKDDNDINYNLTDKQFRAFIDGCMVLDNQLEEDTLDTLINLATIESTKRGYDDWIDAYHEFKEREGQ